MSPEDENKRIGDLWRENARLRSARAEAFREAADMVKMYNACMRDVAPLLREVPDEEPAEDPTDAD